MSQRCKMSILHIISTYLCKHLKGFFQFQDKCQDWFKQVWSLRIGLNKESLRALYSNVMLNVKSWENRSFLSSASQFNLLPWTYHNVQQEHPVNQFQHIIVKASGSLKYKGMDMQTDGKRKREKDREGGSKSAQEYISLDVIKSGERQAGASI